MQPSALGEGERIAGELDRPRRHRTLMKRGQPLPQRLGSGVARSSLCRHIERGHLCPTHPTQDYGARDVRGVAGQNLGDGGQAAAMEVFERGRLCEDACAVGRRALEDCARSLSPWILDAPQVRGVSARVWADARRAKPGARDERGRRGGQVRQDIYF